MRIKITVIVDGEVLTHIRGVVHDYATLCGIDGTDIAVGQETVETPKGQKVDCPQCIAIWQEVRRWKASDFETVV